jgi:hypothetical protein
MAAPADLAGDGIVPHHALLGNILGFLETPTEEKYHAYFYKKKKNSLDAFKFFTAQPELYNKDPFSA